MNLKEDLIITCRTTCGCGNELTPYTKQIETTHYLLTCDPHSDGYSHPLLIAIDKNSPVFEKARKWDGLTNQDYLRVPIGNNQGKPVNVKQNQKLRELFEELTDGDFQTITRAFGTSGIYTSIQLVRILDIFNRLQNLLEESKNEN